MRLCRTRGGSDRPEGTFTLTQILICQSQFKPGAELVVHIGETLPGQSVDPADLRPRTGMAQPHLFLRRCSRGILPWAHGRAAGKPCLHRPRNAFTLVPVNPRRDDQSRVFSRFFPTTHWSAVLAAGGDESTAAFDSLETLCQMYWYPLYAYVRRRGLSPEDAADLTQGFFARFLKKNYLKGLDPARGKFRAFLLASMNHFLSDHRDRETRQKRGGGAEVLSLDAEGAEARYRAEPATDLSADGLYERRWALALVDEVFARLEAEYVRGDKRELFQELKFFIAGEKQSGAYAASAKRLSMTEGALRVAAHRLRKRYGELFRDSVARTVSCPEEIEEEMRHLLRVLG